MLYRELINQYKELIKDDDELEIEGINFIIEEYLSINRSQLILKLDSEVEDKNITLLLDRYVK